MSALSSTELETAIRSVISGGQSYTLPDGRSVTRANLAELRKLLDQTKIDEGAVTRGAVYVPIGFGRLS